MCVTGLAVVDTGTYWSGFGEGVILVLIQVGGFGIMTMASLLALLVSGRLRLRMQLTAQAETKSLGIGDVRRVLLGVAGTTLIVELAVGAILSLRFRFGYGNSIGDAVYLGYFHAVPPAVIRRPRPAFGQRPRHRSVDGVSPGTGRRDGQGVRPRHLRRQECVKATRVPVAGRGNSGILILSMAVP